MRRKQLEEMNLLDDFLFNELISSEKYGERFARCILETILGRKLQKVTVRSQYVQHPALPEEHGIRMDAFVEEEAAEVSGGTIYDIEPDQRSQDKSDLPKRARYYHVLNGSKLLGSGDKYVQLRNAYVIFITPYDPFDAGRMVYTIRNMCVEDPSMPYEDGARTLFLYTKGHCRPGADELKDLLHYMEHTTQQNAVNKKLMELQKMVDSVKTSREEKRVGMKFHEIIAIEREEGRREGWNEGRNEERINTERERQRADRERQRADFIEAELRELKRQITEKNGF